MVSIQMRAGVMVDLVSGCEEWSCTEEDEPGEGAPEKASSPAAPIRQRDSGAAAAQTSQVARLPDLNPTLPTHSPP